METFRRKPTISEKELLRQFKKNISDVLTPLHTDAYLMKWIRAGNFNIRKSEQFFREMVPRDSTSGIEILLLTKLPPKRQNIGHRTNAAIRKREERQN
ncbi:hypothetical protein AVEN_40351-1 [Araneus ventricosus]|uniref:CRAL/TRIO N-terminal domain-containing protein n=1 Tax=Araneus ventricosus TaxID=182803 RepID=A0A4Y2F0S3_ARAVE|nr:hypothetical protein AVEN_40351-1 [Araneus ventricosus]